MTARRFAYAERAFPTQQHEFGVMTFPRAILAAALLVLVTACNNSTPKADMPATTTTATTTAGKTDWLSVTTATPDGGFRIGNPDAKVKLLEFASLTCPHCREFHEEAMATLKAKYIASGNVSYEYRNFVLNGPDFAASMLARCQGAEPFFGLLNAFYTDQLTWVEPFTKMSEADSKRLAALPQDQQIAALAQVGKLDEYVRTRGIPRAKFDACLADKAQSAQIEKLRTEAVEKYKLTGTPGFIINGQTQEAVFTWAQLEPRLQAALQ